MEKIRILLTDWQVLFREGIHFILSGEEDIEITGEASDNEEALSFIEKNPPTLAILNADRQKVTGIEVTRRIKRDSPSVSVILIMDSDNEEQLFSVMKCGASAYLTKEADPDELVNTIRKVAQGGHPITEALLRPAVAARVLEEFDNFAIISEQVNNLLARLSPGEAQTLRGIAERKSVEQVSQTLGISEQGVRQHLDHTLTKLVANDHDREVIEAAQSNLTSLLSRVAGVGEKRKPRADYITRDEFASFKESLKERFKSILGEPT